MDHFASLFGYSSTNKKGSGAAGGISFGLMQAFNCNYTSGAEVLYDTLNLKYQIQKSDLIISGEGKIDNQTKKGKWISLIHNKCLEFNKPMLLFCGQSELLRYNDAPIVSLISKNTDVKEAFKNPEKLLTQKTKEFFNHK